MLGVPGAPSVRCSLVVLFRVLRHFTLPPSPEKRPIKLCHQTKRKDYNKSEPSPQLKVRTRCRDWQTRPAAQSSLSPHCSHPSLASVSKATTALRTFRTLSPHSNRRQKEAAQTLAFSPETSSRLPSSSSPSEPSLSSLPVSTSEAPLSPSLLSSRSKNTGPRAESQPKQQSEG